MTYRLSAARRLLSMFCLALLPAVALAQDVRWYQVEIAIFTHEGFNPDAEIWDSQAPDPFPGTRELIDLSYLPLEQWEALEIPPPPPVTPGPASTPPGLPERPLNAPIEPEPEMPADDFVGPLPPPLPDIRREPFITLPPSQHDFRDTLRTLDRSPNHRLLFHAAWRQPTRQPARSTAVAVTGGEVVGGEIQNGELAGGGILDGDVLNGRLLDTEMLNETRELTGGVRFRFNSSEDRVVLDANLLLRRFDLPDLPMLISQSRDMRSNEFHYVDHPALGIVVQVKPYEVPPPDEVPQEVLQEVPQ